MRRGAAVATAVLWLALGRFPRGGIKSGDWEAPVFCSSTHNFACRVMSRQRGWAVVSFQHAAYADLAHQGRMSLAPPAANSTKR